MPMAIYESEDDLLDEFLLATSRHYNGRVMGLP